MKCLVHFPVFLSKILRVASDRLLVPTQNTPELSSNIVETSVQESVKNYEEHKTRAFVEAVKMDLEISEALPILQEKFSRQIVNLF